MLIPFAYFAAGSLDAEVLRYLANQLVDDWKLVISAFGVPRPRVQSLLRNNGNEKNSDFIHDILVYWIRKIPRLIDKVRKLQNKKFSNG